MGFFGGGGGGGGGSTRSSLGEVYCRAHGKIDFDSPNGDYSLPSGNYKQIGFQTIDADPQSCFGDDGGLYGSSLAVTFTAPYVGLYLFILSLSVSGADGEGYVSFTVNSQSPSNPTAQVIFGSDPILSSSSQAAGQGITQLSLSANDVVRFHFYNNSSGSVQQNSTQQYWNISIARSGL